MNRDTQAHLTDDEIADFVREDLPDELEAVLDKHLGHCAACARQLEDYYDVLEGFPSETWAMQRTDFVAQLRRKIFGTRSAVQRLQTFLERFFALHVLATQFGAVEPTDVESEDGAFGLFVVDDSGNMIIRLDSKETELIGTKVRLFSGEWEQVLSIEEIDNEFVGLKYQFTQADLAQLPERAVVRAEVCR